MMLSGKKELVILTAIFCCLYLTATAQPPRFSVQQYINDKGDTLRYRMLYPDADTLRKYSLVVFLHGAGERGNDNEAQLKWGVTKFATDQNMMLHPAIVIAPQCPEKISWSNFSRPDMKLQPSPSKPMELLIGLIH